MKTRDTTRILLTTAQHTTVDLLPTVTHLITADRVDQDTVATINNKVPEIEMFVEEDVIL